MTEIDITRLGDIWKIIYLGFEKLQRSVMHDSLHYINILTYLLTCCFNTVHAVNFGRELVLENATSGSLKVLEKSLNFNTKI